MSVESMNGPKSVGVSINKSTSTASSGVSSMTNVSNRETPISSNNIEPNDMVEELNLDTEDLNVEEYNPATENYLKTKSLEDIEIAKHIIEEYNGRDISTLNKSEFLEFVSAEAQIISSQTGMLPSIIIAMAIIESNWGQNCEGNNLFGFKAGESWNGKSLSIPVTETTSNGEVITKKENYKYYDSSEEMMNDYIKIISSPRYQPVIEACNNGNVTEACSKLKDCGFTTSNAYSANLTEIIIDNSLGQYDPR